MGTRWAAGGPSGKILSHCMFPKHSLTWGDVPPGGGLKYPLPGTRGGQGFCWPCFYVSLFSSGQFINSVNPYSDCATMPQASARARPAEHGYRMPRRPPFIESLPAYELGCQGMDTAYPGTPSFLRRPPADIWLGDGPMDTAWTRPPRSCMQQQRWGQDHDAWIPHAPRPPPCAR